MGSSAAPESRWTWALNIEFVFEPCGLVPSPAPAGLAVREFVTCSTVRGSTERIVRCLRAGITAPNTADADLGRSRASSHLRPCGSDGSPETSTSRCSRSAKTATRHRRRKPRWATNLRHELLPYDDPVANTWPPARSYVTTARNAADLWGRFMA